MTDKLPAYAFAGSAMSGAGANMVENLAEWLPDACILYVPRAIPKETPLRDLRAWLEDTYDDEDVIRTDNVLAALHLTGAPDHGHELQLCLLYNPDNPEDQELVRAAYEHEIPVHDICNGMYTIPLPGAEEAPAEDKPLLSATMQEDPPWAPDEGSITAEATVEAFLEGPVTGSPAPMITTRDEIAIATVLRQWLRELIREELNSMGLTPGINKPPVITPDEGPVEGPETAAGAAPPLPADVATRRYTRDAEGIHRPRTRGRLRTGFTQVELTDAEAEDLRTNGKLID